MFSLKKSFIVKRGINNLHEVFGTSNNNKISLCLNRNQIQSLKLRKHFCTSKKEEEDDDPDDEEIERRKKLEAEMKQKEIDEKIKFWTETYTPEELEKINNSEEEKVLMEISDENKRKLLFAKKISLYFNVPFSLICCVAIDYGFGDLSEMHPRRWPLYYTALILDYLFFFNSITILAGVRNIVILAKYFPSEKVIEFTKLNLFCKPYKVQEAVKDLKKAGGGNAKLTPFLSCKNKENNSLYSMNGIGEWHDRTLYNTLIPQASRQQKNKSEGMKFLDL